MTISIIYVKMNLAITTLNHFPITQYSIIPVLQHSNGERSELTWASGHSLLTLCSKQWNLTAGFKTALPGYSLM